jgi:hypothetical protein
VPIVRVPAEWADGPRMTHEPEEAFLIFVAVWSILCEHTRQGFEKLATELESVPTPGGGVLQPRFSSRRTGRCPTSI